MRTTHSCLAAALIAVSTLASAGEPPTAEELLATLQKSAEKLNRVRIELNAKAPEVKRPDGRSFTSEVDLTILRDGTRWTIDRALRSTTVENGNRSETQGREQILIGDEMITAGQHVRGDVLGLPIVAATRSEQVATRPWLNLGHCAVLFGRMIGDGGYPLWTVMRESGSLERLPESEVVDGVETWVLTSRGKYGEHRVWLDPASGGLPRRMEVHKHPGNLLDEEQLGTKLVSNVESQPDPRGRTQVFGSRPRSEFSSRIDKIQIEDRAGVFVITGFEEDSNTTYVDGKNSKGKKEHKFRVAVAPNDFPEDAFQLQIAIPNGTRVLVTENGRPIDTKFEWVDGKIRESAGQ